MAYTSIHMHTMLKVVLVLGIAVWIFLMWERAQPDSRVVGETIVRYNEYGEQIDNAETDDRCAQFRKPVDMEGGEEGGSDEINIENEKGVWSLGYGGRIRQLFHGCF